MNKGWIQPRSVQGPRCGLKSAFRVPLRGEGSCGGGGAPRDSAGSGATEEGLTSRGGRHLRLPLRASDVKIAPASCQSPPAQPVIRRMTRQRRLRSPPGKVAVEEPSASTGPIQTPGDTHTEPVGKEKDSKVLKETSGQKLSPAENVTGIRSRLRTLKKKTQPLEDSASVKELFQKPDQAKEADSDVTIAPGPRPSPPAEPVTRPTSRKRRPKSSPEKVDKEEPTPTPG